MDIDFLEIGLRVGSRPALRSPVVMSLLLAALGFV